MDFGADSSLARRCGPCRAKRIHADPSSSISTSATRFLLSVCSHSVRPAVPLLEDISAPGWILLTLAAALLILLAFLPALKRRMEGSDSFYARAFIDYLDQPKIGYILAFILLYRTGESFLLNMLYPFLKDIGITRAQYGWAYGTFGVAASIVGGILGGHLISKFTLKRMIWPFVLGQNVLNLLYMGLAWHYQDFWMNPGTGTASLDLVRAFIVIEAFGAGLGTSAFMVFIMRTTKPDFKAAHFAIATSLMQISATLAGVVSGFLAAGFGFTIYFGLTFAATLPGMALIFFLPYLDGSSAADQ